MKIDVSYLFSLGCDPESNPMCDASWEFDNDCKTNPDNPYEKVCCLSYGSQEITCRKGEKVNQFLKKSVNMYSRYKSAFFLSYLEPRKQFWTYW